MNPRFKFLFVILFSILLLGVVSAHEETEDIKEEVRTDEIIRSNTIFAVTLGSIILFIFTLLAIYYPSKTEKTKAFFFWAIALTAIIVTLYIAGGTIYLNLSSETQGPVHWHTDFEIWNCDNFVELASPGGISNRIGSSVLHEHGDNRVHAEGVLIKKEHADLHSFFEVISGSLTKDKLVVPTDSGNLEIKSGDSCNGKPGVLQVFLYRITNPDPTKKSGFTYKQTKLDNFEEYIMAPYGNIPPGDCIIIEFAQEKEKTDYICESYSVSLRRGDIKEA